MYQIIMQIRVKVKRKKKTKFSPENKPVMPRNMPNIICPEVIPDF